MKIAVCENTQYLCAEHRIGDWRFILKEIDFEEPFVDFFDVKNTFYSYLGFQLHAQQQSLCVIYYKGLPVHCEKFEDTSGYVEDCTVLLVGTVRMPLALLTEDFEIVEA